MAIKKKKIRKALFYIILRHLKTKVWNLNEGKFGLKSTFKKENKGVFHQTVKNILVSEREKLMSGFADLQCFADLYCYVRKFFKYFSIIIEPPWCHQSCVLYYL